jgi:hypothetical protein
MPIPEWIVVASIIGGALAVAAFAAWMLGSVLEDYFSMKWQKQFEEDLALAIKNSEPSWEQILQIAASRHVKHTQVYWVLQRTLREVLTGRNPDLAPHRAVVEAYIAKMKESEPFEGIPNEIRIHLERLREHLPATNGLLEPLTSQIRELLAVNEKEQKQQKYYTVGGCFLGILGFIFAAYAYYFPYQAPSASPTVSGPPTSTASSPSK